MRAKFWTLCGLVLLVFWGVAGSSCERRGIMARINRDGKGFTELMPIQIESDFLYGEYSDFRGHVTLPTERIFVGFIGRYEIRDFYGRARFLENTGLRSTPIVSWNGNYAYHGAQRFFINDDPVQEQVIPADLYDYHDLMNVSDDDRYVFLRKYSYSSTEFLLWDNLEKSHQTLSLMNTDYNTRGLYVASQDRIYYSERGTIKAVKPDGSGAETILYAADQSQYSVSRLLPGEKEMLFYHGFSLCLLDLETHDVQVLAENVTSYDYAPFSKELYYISSQRVWCRNLESGETRHVYRGKRNDFNMSHGLRCSWDGNYLFIAGTVPR